MFKLHGFRAHYFNIYGETQGVPNKSTQEIQELIAKANLEVLPLLKILFTPAQLKWVCVAGGYTRNILIGKPINDIDIFTSLPRPTSQRDWYQVGEAVLKKKTSTIGYNYGNHPCIETILSGEFNGTPFDMIYLDVDTYAPIALATAATFDSVLSSGALVYNIGTDSLDFVCTATFLRCLNYKEEIYNYHLGGPQRYTKLCRLYEIPEKPFGIALRYRTVKAATKHGAIQSDYTIIRVPTYGGSLFDTLITIDKDGNTYDQTCVRIPLGLREKDTLPTFRINDTTYSLRNSHSTLSSASSWEEIQARFPLTTYTTQRSAIDTRVQGIF